MTATIRRTTVRSTAAPAPRVVAVRSGEHDGRRPAAQPRSVARRRATMYRRRRAFAGVAMAGAVGVAAMVAGGVLAGPGGDPASAAGAGTALSTPRHVVRVRAGDTLWSIAVEHHGDAPLMRYLDALIDRNGGTVIEVGQLVQLP